MDCVVPLLAFCKCLRQSYRLPKTLYDEIFRRIKVVLMSMLLWKYFVR